MPTPDVGSGEILVLRRKAPPTVPHGSGEDSKRLAHMEFHGSCTVEDLLEEIILVACEMSASVWYLNIL